MSEAVMRRLAKPLLFLAAFIWGTSFFIMKNTLAGRALRGIPLYRLHHPDLRPDRDHPLQERLPHRHLLRAGPLSGLAGVSPAARPV